MLSEENNNTFIDEILIYERFNISWKLIGLIILQTDNI